MSRRTRHARTDRHGDDTNVWWDRGPGREGARTGTGTSTAGAARIDR